MTKLLRILLNYEDILKSKYSTSKSQSTAYMYLHNKNKVYWY